MKQNRFFTTFPLAEPMTPSNDGTDVIHRQGARPFDERPALKELFGRRHTNIIIVSEAISRPDVGSTVVIKLLGGEYDLSRKDVLLEELLPARSASRVILDCADVAFMDSTALGCLIGLKRAMIERDPKSEIRLLALRPPIERLFRIAGLSKVFEIVPVE